MTEQVTIGWREWVSLPGLNIPSIKAKIDTGARTSSLHAYHLETFGKNGGEMVRFYIHPLQRRTDIRIECMAPIIDFRTVKDSGGHAEERFVIESLIRLGDNEFSAEITLTSRDDMLFRMLLGRTAIIAGQLSVNPSLSYVMGKSLRNAYRSN